MPASMVARASSDSGSYLGMWLTNMIGRPPLNLQRELNDELTERVRQQLEQPHWVAVNTPSSVSTWPVTNADASEQKKRIAPTMSSVSAMRRSGIRATSFS